MTTYVLYCRPGFEKDLAAEIQHKASEKEIYGYCKLKDSEGFITFDATENEVGLLFKVLKLDELIFCRQWIRVIDTLTGLAEGDRISPIIQSLAGQEFSELTIDYPDTNDGKEIARFAKKFTLPLTKALEKQKLFKKYDKRRLHLFIEKSDTIILGLSPLSNSSKNHLGIQRLKFPKDAPSRSTLKLEEAFKQFIPEHEWEFRLKSGMHSVDLGSAPGGWTYQLVKLGMFVAAVDNGPMDPVLMETGQVKHHQEDGFVFKPKKNNVHWLVCDMVEKPSKVAKLMATWLGEGHCKEAIFNLKLPMKQRFQTLESCFEQIASILSDYHCDYRLQAKHLYHDREEITVHLQVQELKGW